MYLCSYLAVYRKMFFHAIRNILPAKFCNTLYSVQVSQIYPFGLGVLTSGEIVFFPIKGKIRSFDQSGCWCVFCPEMRVYLRLQGVL